LTGPGNENTLAPEDKLRWANILKAQGWGYYRAAFTHGRKLWDTALETFRQAGAIFRELGDKEGLAGTLSGEATVLRSTGDPEAIRRATELYQEGIDLLKELGREDHLPEALVNLALAHRDLATVEPTEGASLEQGVRACREALETAKIKNQPDNIALAASALGDLCLIMARLDRPEYRETHLKEALGFYGQAEKLWDGRDADGAALARLGLAEAYITLGENLGGARDLLEDRERYFNPKLEGRPVTLVLTSRGCSFQCYYCVPNAISWARELEWKRFHKGKKPPVTLRSPENIVAEFEEIKRQGYGAVSIIDDMFLFGGKERVLSLCRGLERVEIGRATCRERV